MENLENLENLDLWQAAEFDTRDSLLLDVQLEEITNVSKGKGCGPDIQTKQRKKVKANKAAKGILGREAKSIMPKIISWMASLAKSQTLPFIF